MERVCHAVTTRHKGSQTVTKSHQAPAPTLSGSHIVSQRRTKHKPHRNPRATKASPVTESETIVEQHTRSGSAMQSQHQAQPQGFLGVARCHEVDRKTITKSHPPSAPAHLARCTKSKTTCKNTHTHGVGLPRSHNEPQGVTNSHKITPGPSPNAFWESQSVASICAPRCIQFCCFV